MPEGRESASLLRARDDVDLSFERIRALLETLVALYLAHGEPPTPETLAIMIGLALDHLKVMERLWRECEELYRGRQSAGGPPRSVN